MAVPSKAVLLARELSRSGYTATASCLTRALLTAPQLRKASTSELVSYVLSCDFTNKYPGAWDAPARWWLKTPTQQCHDFLVHCINVRREKLFVSFKECLAQLQKAKEDLATSVKGSLQSQNIARYITRAEQAQKSLQALEAREREHLKQSLHENGWQSTFYIGYQ